MNETKAARIIETYCAMPVDHITSYLTDEYLEAKGYMECLKKARPLVEALRYYASKKHNDIGVAELALAKWDAAQGE